MNSSLFIALLFLPATLLANTDVAVVRIVKGTVEGMTLGKTVILKTRDTLPVGAVVKTAAKSFAQLELKDKSIMNVGPNSEMKIASFSDDEAGVIDFVKGKVRAQVTKQDPGTGGSKLIIKTANAVMGVRGTDFILNTNGHSTSSVLFEGEIAFNKLSEKGMSDPRSLDAVLAQGVRLQPGEFSVMSEKLSAPTLPARMNIDQLERLESNPSFDVSETPATSEKEKAGSVVPKGLSGTIVANAETVVDEALGEVSQPLGDSSVAKGFVDGNKVRPANGSFLHLESGVIIPPAPDAVYDANSNSFISPPSAGSVGSDGSFQPPANMEITPKGDIIITSTEAGGTVKREIASTTVIAPVSSTSDTTTTSSTTVTPVPTMILPPPPSGGVQGVNDPQRTNGGYTDVIFRSR